MDPQAGSVPFLPPGDPEATRGSLARANALGRVRPFVSSQAFVVFEGEPGVGKQFHARLLHDEACGKEPASFVVVTPETPEDVLRALLFGDDRKKVEGKIGKRLPVLDSRSTLFLESVSQFALMSQALFSRFLIEQGQRPMHTPSRVLLSSVIPQPDLLRKLTDSFAQSLQQYQVCRIPPLRERLDELPSLVDEILSELRHREQENSPPVTEDVLQKLRSRHWRDNITELKYVVEGAVFSSTDGTLRLPTRFADEMEIVQETLDTIRVGKRFTLDHSLADLEKALIERALVRCRFNQGQTARMLQMTEPNLVYRLKKYNIYLPLIK